MIDVTHIPEVSPDEWEDFEEKLNRMGLDIGDQARKNIASLQVLKDIGRQRECGMISEDVAKKAAWVLYEMMKDAEGLLR